MENMDEEKATEEFGDLLFAMVNAARLYKIRPDNALEKTNDKFIKRFNYIEQQAKEKGRFRPSYCLLHLCDGGEFFPYFGLAVRLYASLRHVQFAGGEGGVG